jgi:hypothetical protein
MTRFGYKLTRGAPGREKEADSLREFHAWGRVRLVPAASFFRVKGRLRRPKGRLSVREPFPLNGRSWQDPVRWRTAGVIPERSITPSQSLHARNFSPIHAASPAGESLSDAANVCGFVLCICA